MAVQWKTGDRSERSGHRTKCLQIGWAEEDSAKSISKCWVGTPDQVVCDHRDRVFWRRTSYGDDLGNRVRFLEVLSKAVKSLEIRSLEEGFLGMFCMGH